LSAARNNSVPTRKFMLLYEILKKSSTDNQLINVIHFVLSLGQSNFSLSFLNAYKYLISFFRFLQSLSRLLPQCPLFCRKVLSIKPNNLYTIFAKAERVQTTTLRRLYTLCSPD